MRRSNPHRPDLAGSQRLLPGVGNIADPVYLGRLSRKPRLPYQVRIGRRTFNQHREMASHQGAVPRARNLSLESHQPPLSIVYRASIHFAVQLEAGACVFIGIRKHAHPIKLCRLDELAQRLEILFGLARKTHDHAGADCDARDGAADALDQP